MLLCVQLAAAQSARMLQQHLGLDTAALQPLLTGVRYPSHLLPEVTALLQSAEQAAALAQSQLQAHGTAQKQQQQQEKVPACKCAANDNATRFCDPLIQWLLCQCFLFEPLLRLSMQAMKASAMGAASAVRHEPPTPVDAKSLAKAFRCLGHLPQDPAA